MVLILEDEYKNLGAVLSRMAHDLSGAKDVVDGMVFRKKDCELIKECLLENSNEDEPWVGLLSQMRLKAPEGGFKSILSIAMQLCNEWDAHVIESKGQ